MTTEPIITPKIAREVLFQFDATEGIDPGYTFNKFYEFLSHADENVMARAALGFPVEVAAFTLARKPGGIGALRIIAAMPLLTLVSE